MQGWKRWVLIVVSLLLMVLVGLVWVFAALSTAAQVAGAIGGTVGLTGFVVWLVASGDAGIDPRYLRDEEFRDG